MTYHVSTKQKHKKAISVKTLFIKNVHEAPPYTTAPFHQNGVS